MMFCEYPDKFFPYMQVDIVKFPEGSVNNPNNLIEVPSIKGSAPTIIKRTMEKLQDMVIEEMVTKVNYQMEAIRRYSYPYQSLEEVVVNALYHRNYMSYEPVHIEIEPDCINVISFDGPDRSISMKAIKEGERFVARVYQNRRLGEFFKELELSEGHSTGIPTIQKELIKNGSPRARFYTDEDRKAFTVTIPIHPDFIKRNMDVEENVIENVIENNFSRKSEYRIRIILKQMELNSSITIDLLAKEIGVSTRTISRDIEKLKKIGCN